MASRLNKLLLPAFTTAVLAVGTAHADGYWVDGSGTPIQSGGACVKFGYWAATPAVKGCDPIAKPARIVLLPDPSGKAGAVAVRNPAGEQLLNEAYRGLEAGGTGPMQRVTETEASVRARYGDVLNARPPRPLSFVVRFETGSAAQLTAESAAVLDELGKALATWPAPQLMIVGHTDRVGTDQANDALSLQRAQAVARILVERGMPAQQIESAGRGEREPLVPTADGVANATNRRVEITLR